jgi:hypothetical protein
MQEYPIKRGLTKDLEARAVAELKNCFGAEPEKTPKGYRIRAGALKRLDVVIGPGGKSVIIDTESDITAADEIIMDTNKRFRKFLDAVTGFSTKERVKRAKSVVGE